MKLFKRYLDDFAFDIRRPAGKVISALQLHIDKSKKNFIADKLFYAETYRQLSNHTFKIIRQPAYFQPFRGTGQITIKLLQGDAYNKTKVVIQTAPLEGSKYRFAFMIFIIIIFTALALLTSTNVYTFIYIIMLWTVFPLIGHFWFKWNKTKLRAYAYTFLRKVLDQSERTT